MQNIAHPMIADGPTVVDRFAGEPVPAGLVVKCHRIRIPDGYGGWRVLWTDYVPSGEFLWDGWWW